MRWVAEPDSAAPAPGAGRDARLGLVVPARWNRGAPLGVQEVCGNLCGACRVRRFSWPAPGQPQAVLAWEQARLPRRFMPGDSDFGPPSWDRTFSLPPIPGVLNGRDMVVEVTGAGND